MKRATNQKQKPKIIIGSGGYASFPVLMAAYFLRIKIVIYETNSILGRTNKFFYRFAQKLLLGFDNINDVRQGKYFEIEVNDTDQEKAKGKVDEMCKKLLANLVIENYKIIDTQ